MIYIYIYSYCIFLYIPYIFALKNNSPIGPGCLAGSLRPHGVAPGAPCGSPERKTPRYRWLRQQKRWQNLGKTMENTGKTMEKPGKTMENTGISRNDLEMIVLFYGIPKNIDISQLISHGFFNRIIYGKISMI